MPRLVMPGVEACRVVRKETDTVLLAFSSGKDSVVAWLRLRQIFPRVIPFYMFLVPDLHFVEVGLRYYEDYFGTKIHRVPHPSLYRMLDRDVYQPPDRLDITRRCRLPTFEHKELEQWVCEDFNLDRRKIFVATGIRAADTPHRRMFLARTGPIDWKNRRFYPVHDVNKATLILMMKKAGLKLPPDYAMFGRSFDGIGYQYLEPISRHYPKDFKRILDFFPLADLELFRASMRARHGTS